MNGFPSKDAILKIGYNIRIQIHKLEFNQLMIEFYETKKADNICDFLVCKCIDD